MSFLQAIVMGLFQGVTELVPISSLGHIVLMPELLGWKHLARSVASPESFYLAFVVALHVATALALLWHYRSTWVRVIRGLFTSSRNRRIDNPDERLAWLLVVGTIPVGITGLALEHYLRVAFAKPSASAAFLIVNALVLALAERLRRRQPGPVQRPAAQGVEPPGRQLATMEMREAGVIGIAQTAALLAGISRSGVTMAGGLVRGLNHEDAARFSFLLATPVIFAAGVYKIPDLLGHLGDGIRGQALAGGVAAFFAALVAVNFLEKYFERRNLIPFAIYCAAIGIFSLVFLNV